MKSPIKVVKRKQDESLKRDEDANELKTPETEASTERGPSDIASTVKGWIVELQQRKRAQSHSFPRLPIIVNTASPNT